MWSLLHYLREGEAEDGAGSEGLRVKGTASCPSIMKLVGSCSRSVVLSSCSMLFSSCIGLHGTFGSSVEEQQPSRLQSSVINLLPKAPGSCDTSSLVFELLCHCDTFWSSNIRHSRVDSSEVMWSLGWCRTRHGVSGSSLQTLMFI